MGLADRGRIARGICGFSKYRFFRIVHMKIVDISGIMGSNTLAMPNSRLKS